MESDKGISLNDEGDSTSVICSVCLDPITNGGERSLAKLQCGHEFHLDCIGSAFNMKGTMQCPNCRRIETGQWLYASGSTNSPPSVVDESTDTDPYYLSYTETPYRVRVCPFRGLTQVHPFPEPSLGIMSRLPAMVSHQLPGLSGPHPQGWIQFHHTPFQARHPLPPSLPMPIGNGSGRFDSQRSLPRFIPPDVYDQSGSFSLHGEAPLNYSHPWVRDNHQRFPLQ